MKRMLMILLLTALTSACQRPASSAPATVPALDFPTLAPGSIPRCQPADLTTSSNSNGATGAIVLGVTLTNKNKSPCTLSNPPQASLLDSGGQPIDLQTTIISPEQTPPAPALMKLAPGESAIASLVWRNYCQLPNTDRLILRLELAKGQNLNVEMKALALPSCNAKEEPSTITVAPYSVPP